MTDPRDYKLDIASLVKPADSPSAASADRPFLSVHFACCGIYQRIYRNADGTHYTGHCPRCAKPVRFAIQPGGTTARQFVVE